MIWFILDSGAVAATLSEAWSAAESAPELTAAGSRLEAARASVGAARAALVPKLATSAGATWTDEAVELDLGATLPPELLTAIGGAPAPFVIQEQSWAQAQATLVVPLVDADGWSTLRAAARSREAAGYDVAVASRQLRVGVARAFYGSRAAREGVRLAEEALAVARTQLEVAARRVEVGDAPPRTRLEAEQATLVAERDVLAAREQQVLAEEALHRLTGLPRDVALEEGPAPAAEVGRPEVPAASARVEAASAALAATRWAWAPDLTGRVTTQWTTNEGFAPNEVAVFAGVEATWTFDGGWRAARAREASADVVAASAQVEIAARAAEQDARAARAALERATASAAAAARELEVAEVRLREAELAFGQGLLPFTELDRAVLAHTAAAVAESRERNAAALAAVEVALAGGPVQTERPQGDRSLP